VTIADLQTGQRTAFRAGGQPATTSRIVADNGTAVLVDYGSLYIITLGGLESPRVSSGAASAVIDSSGQIILYAVSFSPPRTIRLLNLATHEDRLFLQADGDTYAPGISADGKRATFISTPQFGATRPSVAPQLYAVNLDCSGLRPITNDPDGVLTYTLSDDGQVAFARLQLRPCRQSDCRYRRPKEDSEHSTEGATPYFHQPRVCADARRCWDTNCQFAGAY
jgi:hypothetical protein